MTPRPAAVAEVSVVIAAYNHGRYVAQAIDSVLSQEPSPREVLRDDAGSTDNTAAVVARYASRVTYLRIDHSGAATARNAGWRRATSRWVGFIDADDWWLPGKLAAQLQRFEDDRVGLVYSDIMRVDPDGVPIARWSDSAPPVEGRVVAAQLRRNRVQTSTVVVPRHILEELDGFDPHLEAWEDIDLWLRIAARYAFAHVPDVLAGYRMLPGSLSGRRMAMARGHQASVEAFLGSVGSDLVPARLRRAAKADAMTHVAIASYLESNMVGTRRNLWRAARADPMAVLRSRWLAVGLKSLLGGRLVATLRQRRRTTA